jgi:hypothetical protein
MTALEQHGRRTITVDIYCRVSTDPQEDNSSLEAVLKGLGSRGKCDRMEEKEGVRTGNRECWC